MKQSDFESLTRRARNLTWAYRNYDDYDMYKDFNFKSEQGIITLKSSIFQYGYSNNSTIKFHGDDISFECNCYFCTKHDACGHVLSAILMYEEINEDLQHTSYTYDDFQAMVKDREKDILIELREKQERILKQSKIDRAKQLSTAFNNSEKSVIHKLIDKHQYHLEFEITLRYDTDTRRFFNDYNQPEVDYNDVPYFEIRAKIGKDKLYVIKNFEEFFDILKHEKNHKYGAKLEFIHSQEVFEEEVQSIFKNLEKLFLLSDEIYNNKREIIVDEEYMHLLFDTFKDYPSEYMDYNFIEEDFHVELNVEKDEHSLFKVTLNKPDDLSSINNFFYTLTPTTLVHHKIDNDKLLLLVRNLHTEDYLLFSKEDLNNVLNHIGENDNLEVNGFDYEKDIISDVSLYIDVENDQLFIKGVLIKDGKEINLFNSKNQSVDYTVNNIKYVIESYATEMKVSGAYLALDQEKTYRFLEEGLSFLEGMCTVYADESLKNIQRPTSLNLSIGVSLDNHLLEVDIDSLQFDKDEISKILDQYRRKKKYYKLKSGEIINLESCDLEELDTFVDHMNINPKELNKEKVKLPLYRTLQVQDELSKLDVIKQTSTEILKTFNENFKNYQLDDLVISDKYEPILKDYQKHGVKWMMLLAKYGFHGILADDMGLGKTLQVIALLESDLNRSKQSIVICPASLLFNWEAELKKFDSKLSYACVHGSKDSRVNLINDNKDKELIITTYDYLRQDADLYKDQFSYIIIDEAQYIKNQKTITAKAVKSLQGDHRIALTGTPIENSLAELWSLFDFLMPGYLYSYNYFRGRFEIPIVKDNDEEKQRTLRNLVEPFILRRIKKDVLKDLPDKIEKVLTVEFEEEEEKLYLAKLAQGNKEVQATLESEKVDSILILKLLTELRQLCCDPRLLFEEYTQVSSKMKACLDLIEPLQKTNQKVLLFSSFTSTLDLLEKELKKKGIKYHMLTGKNSKEERRTLVEDFQTDDSTVFLISLRAAGVGLNLTSAEYVIHFDPWWNVAAENQASDRAHRIGQKKNVQVFKLIMKNSIEEKILKMQEKKQDMADIFVEGASGSFASLSKEDIMDLFKR